MLRFLKGLLLSFGVLFLVLIVGAAIGLRYAANQWQPEPLPEHMVLSLTLEPELRETSGIFSLENVFEGGEPSILDIVNTLKVASEDERVKGLFLDFSFAQVRPAKRRNSERHWPAFGPVAVSCMPMLIAWKAMAASRPTTWRQVRRTSLYSPRAYSTYAESTSLLRSLAAH